MTSPTHRTVTVEKIHAPSWVLRGLRYGIPLRQCKRCRHRAARRLPGHSGAAGGGAALAVAFLHVADEAGALVGTPGRAPYSVVDALPFEAGVDMFFVISGFVMVWASWPAFGQVRSAGPFVWRAAAADRAALLAADGGDGAGGAGGAGQC